MSRLRIIALAGLLFFGLGFATPALAAPHSETGSVAVAQEVSAESGVDGDEDKRIDEEEPQDEGAEERRLFLMVAAFCAITLTVVIGGILIRKNSNRHHPEDRD